MDNDEVLKQIKDTLNKISAQCTYRFDEIDRNHTKYGKEVVEEFKEWLSKMDSIVVYNDEDIPFLITNPKIVFNEYKSDMITLSFSLVGDLTKVNIVDVQRSSPDGRVEP